MTMPDTPDRARLDELNRAANARGLPQPQTKFVQVANYLTAG
jgi:hypothetical protein